VLDKDKLSHDDVLYLAQREQLPGVGMLDDEVIDAVGGQEELEEALYSNQGFGKSGSGAERREVRKGPRNLEDEGAPAADGVAATLHEFPKDEKEFGDPADEDAADRRKKGKSKAKSSSKSKSEDEASS
jgi:hypothetical protein